MGGTKVGGNAGYPYPSTDQFTAIPVGTAKPDFVVGVIDTGISLHNGAPHAYLGQNLAPGYGIEGPGGPGQAPRGHGTFQAGLVLHEAPFATIAMSNALDGDLDEPKVYEQRIAEAIDRFATLDNLRVLVMTFYSDAPDSSPGKPVETAFLHLVQACPDLVVVTAVRNDWSDTPSYPAAFKDKLAATDRRRVVTVGAVDETLSRYDDEPWREPPRASFTNWHGVDVWASGVRILGPHLHAQPWDGDEPWNRDGSSAVTETFTGWARWSGSSFAGAAVAGLIARALHDDDTLHASDALARITGQPKGTALPAHNGHYVRGSGSMWPPPTGAGASGA